MFLSAIEYAIPKPLPFLRLGLANLPILLALKRFSFKDYILLVILKVLTQALVSGTVLSYVFVFSICGTLAAGISMYGLWKLLEKSGKISYIGVSLIGALFNNAMQLLLCYVMMFQDNTKYIVTLMLTFGSITGLLLGIFANLFERNSSWLLEPKVDDIKIVENFWKTNGRYYVLLVIGIVLLTSVCFVKNLIVLWSLVFSAFIMNYILRKRKIKVLPSIIIIISIVIMNLIQPNGRLLITCGNFRITQGALETGLLKSGKLVGMVFASQIAFSKSIKVPGIIGLIISNVIKAFNILTENRIEFQKKNVLKVLDDWIDASWKKYAFVEGNKN